MILLAVPAAYSADLAPLTIEFELTTEDPAVDMSDAIAVRAVVTRSDVETLVWSFDIGATTSTSATVTSTVDVADFFDAAGAPVAPATYSARFLVEFPDGERPMSLAWLAVERF